MMENELIDIIQSRMVTSYNEQIWAVAIVGSLCGFVIVNVSNLIKSIGIKWLMRGIWVTTAICLLFVLTRFGVYYYYSRMVDSQHSILINLPWYMSVCRWAVLISGTLVYVTVVIGMNRAAILTCKKANVVSKTNAEDTIEPEENAA